MENAKKLLQETLSQWQRELKKFKPGSPKVFTINSSFLHDEDAINNLLEQIKAIQGSCIYRLSIKEKNHCKLIHQRFDKFQTTNKPDLSKEKRYISRLIAKESKCLYVGSKRNKVYERIKQHFGYGPAKTYSLDLKHWFPRNIDIVIEIYSVAIDNELLVALEQHMWANSKPMFGKKSGL